MIDVTVPQLGESVTEGTITKWLVKEGDMVAKDQTIAEIATDKADSELPSPSAGRIAQLLAKEGDVVPVRSVICKIDDTAKGEAGAAAPHALKRRTRRRPHEFAALRVRQRSPTTRTPRHPLAAAARHRRTTRKSALPHAAADRQLPVRRQTRSGMTTSRSKRP